MNLNHEWMYKRYFSDGSLNPNFLKGLESFIQFASSQPTFLDEEKIKCPCRQCDNIPYQTPYIVRLHISKFGFVNGYHIWRFQGETELGASNHSNLVDEFESNTYRTMVMDVAGPEFTTEDIEDPPNPEAQELYDMLKAADRELWHGCKTHSQLSLVARLMTLKSENGMSEKCFDQITALMKEIVHENNLVSDNFYSTKKLLRGMGLPVEKIDRCSRNCMIYWADDSELIECKFCGHPRLKPTSKPNGKRVAYKKMYYFPLTPRLQRLYASNATAKEMRWHASSVDDGVMRHPADSPTWKHLNQTFPDFALEIRNIRLGLSTDGFQPFGQSGQQYSSWPVILTPYNLPPWLCMKEQFMFLTVLVPGPRNPKEKLDVFLQPLISELKKLWNVGVATYDASLKQNFLMRAAVIWTINDFPAYSMLSGWSTAGRLACPHCGTESDAFTLSSSGRTKDTPKSREELNNYCSRPELKRDERTKKFPKACYTVDKAEKKVLCEWVKQLKFPDGYVSNMSRCVDMQKLKMFGMKSHDCHVLMQRILPIAFRELLPLAVWKAITELSLFFRDLSSATIKMEDMCRLHEMIPVILCKLERIFPPTFFDSMEHLPVHLADEARIGGPVQYRWMYPFERYLRKLKNNVRNKARVEGSICNAYLVEEASTFCSYYFEDHVKTRHRNVPRNYDGRGDVVDDNPDCLSIFKYPGRSFGKESRRYMIDDEYKAAHIYVLLNCSEVEPYIHLFTDHMQIIHPRLSRSEIDSKVDTEFANWFAKYVHDPVHNVNNKYIQDLSKGPLRSILVYHGYYINGYKFHTINHGTHRATMNSGVCIKGASYGTYENAYYGRLLEVFELEYPGLPIKKTVLFKCEWFDTSAVGTMVHPEYKLVSINHKRRYNRYEPFVLAKQAIQVYYCSYPSLSRSKSDWWAVCKIKARSNLEVPDESSKSNADGSGSSMVKHKGGSRSAVEHAAILAKEKGLPPDQIAYEVFLRLHSYRTADGVLHFTDDTTRLLYDVIEEEAIQLEQHVPGTTDQPHQANRNEIYERFVLQKSKKRRVFRQGNRTSAYYNIFGGGGNECQL